MKFLLFLRSLTLFLGTFLNCWAQDHLADTSTISYLLQPNRIEFESPDFDTEFTIINAGINGLMVLELGDEKVKKGVLWKSYYLDTALQVIWQKKIFVPFGAELVGYEYAPDAFYLLTTKNQFKPNELQLTRLNRLTADTTGFSINTVFPIEMTHFEIVGNTALIAGTSNFLPVILLYNLNTRRPMVIPGFYAERTEIQSIKINDSQNSFEVIVSEYSPTNGYTLSLKIFNHLGELLQSSHIIPSLGTSLLDGAYTSFSENQGYLAGTYSQRKSKYSKGIFMTSIENNTSSDIKYYNYADLDHFFSYLKERKQKAIKEKIARKKELGKKVHYSYRLNVHDLIRIHDQVLLIGEAYYPKYGNDYTSMNPVGYRGAPYTYSPTSQFLGYHYTHSIVVAFDTLGNKLWDNSFEINDVLSWDLKQFVHVLAQGDELILVYVHDNMIRSKKIMQNQIVEGKTQGNILLTHSDDAVKEFDKHAETLDDWYGKSLWVSGYQKLKNLKDSGVRLNRDVFYINKITYTE